MATNPDTEVKPPGATTNTTADELNVKVEAISLQDKKNAGEDVEDNEDQVAEEAEQEIDEEGDEDSDDGEVEQDEFGVMKMDSLCMNCHENVCLTLSALR